MKVRKKMAASRHKRVKRHKSNKNINNQLPQIKKKCASPYLSPNVNELTAVEPLKETEDEETEMNKVFTLCNVQVNVKFSYALPFWNQKSVLKVDEGSYAEIYCFQHSDGSSRIFKCIPLNGQRQRSPTLPLKLAFPDMVSSTSLSSLRENPLFLALNFPTVHRISIIKDKFPERIIEAWWIYKDSPHRCQDSEEHPPPDLYDKTQRFLAIETSFCGTPLPIKLQELRDAWIGVSIMSQLVSALAVAEEAFEFEHRDLHLSNLLIHETGFAALNYTIRNLNFSVQTVGHHLYIIDFTISRINKDGKVYCIELDQLSDIITNDDNGNTWLNHRNLYGMMSEYFNGNWRQFMPKTNVIWLKYVSENILEFLRRNNPDLHQVVEEPGEYDQVAAMELLKRWNDRLLSCDSAKSFLLDELLRNNRLVEVVKEQ